MKNIVLISCASAKLPHKSRARDLYVSALFQKNLAYALSLAPDRIFILSAKYGLLGLEQEIEPYDVSLNQMNVASVRVWASMVLRQLAEQADLEQDLFIFLAGDKYRKYLVPHLRKVRVPLEGLRIGEQLRRLNQSAEQERA